MGACLFLCLVVMTVWGSHTDWTDNFSYVINKIIVSPDLKSIALCNTIRELCEIRDGTKQCEILLNIEFVEALISQLCVE